MVHNELKSVQVLIIPGELISTEGQRLAHRQLLGKDHSASNGDDDSVLVPEVNLQEINDEANLCMSR